MKTILIATLSLLFLSGYGQKKPEVYSSSSGAVSGYDPVAYFTNDKPVKGNPKFSFNWKNATWLFSTKQHMDSFTLNPNKYAPQYGGWCAYGCSQGHKAPTDPTAWTIVDGKLYLNYSPQVKELWIKDQKEKIKQADLNWLKIKEAE